jgi:twitching motility two-component system response regulator PilG
MNEMVLVADDSIATQKLFELALGREGYQVIAVGSGADALDHVKQKKPDIAFIDAIMPDLDGYQVCKTLKQTKEFSNLPVVLLAGTFEDFDEKKGQQVGADAILNKPCAANLLVSKVKELLLAKKSKSAPETSAKPTPSKIKVSSAVSRQPPKQEVSAPVEEKDLFVKEVRKEVYESKPEEEIAEEDLKVLEEELLLDEETIEEQTIEPVHSLMSDVIQEPSSLEEEFEFDEPRSTRAVEEEILEELPEDEDLLAEETSEEELLEEELLEEELPEEVPAKALEEEEVFIEEELVEELPEEVSAEVLQEEEPVVAEVASSALVTTAKATEEEKRTPSEPLVTPSSEQVDVLVDQISQRVAGKLLPLFSQELANYLVNLPFMEHLIHNMSQKLVKEILPELEKK